MQVSSANEFSDLRRRKQTIEENDDSIEKKDFVSYLKSIENQIPFESLSQKNSFKALRTLLFSTLLCVVGYVGLVNLPVYYWPFLWLFLGAVFAGFTSIMHDCKRGSFSPYNAVNALVGNIVSVPLMLPFDSWKHQIYSFESWMTTGWAWWLTSAAETIMSNIYLIQAFKPGNRRQLVLSVFCTYLFALIFFPTMYFYFGLTGILKFWLLPWLAYHFWMSTFISLSYKIPFLEEGTRINLSIRFPTKYPKWLELITNDINYVLATTRAASDKAAQKLQEIPNHNLRKLYDVVKDRIHESELKIRQFSLSFKLLGDLCDHQCNGTVKKSFIGSLMDVLENFNWFAGPFLLITPFVALYALFTIPIQLNTMIFAFFWYQFGGLGITVGYHRYFSHRAFDAAYPIRILMLIAGTSAFEGSCLWWCRDHRVHHRYVDTDRDPYSIKKGFFYAHMGWLLTKQDEKKIGSTDVSDLESDPVIQFQHKYYGPVAFVIGFGIPTLICGLAFNDWLGGFFFAGILRAVVVQHCTFCINSLAHVVGDSPFDEEKSAKDCWWVSLFTMGEGYHNFHHQFPYDYRNGIASFAYDPSKWIIWTWEKLGLAYNVKRFPTEEIEKCRLELSQKRIEKEMKQYDWGKKIEELPAMTSKQFRDRCGEGANLIKIDGIIHDVSEFKKIHPGGINFIQCYIGKDASDAFKGGVYKHSSAARHILATHRVARLEDEQRI